MKRPQPKELVVRQIDTTIVITAMSEDARSWIMREAPQFGSVGGFVANRTILMVSDTYNPAEVAAWLASYNDGQEGETR